MGTILLGILMKLRKWVQAIFGNTFNKIRDPKTGKIQGMNPRSVITILWVVGIGFFIVIMSSKFLTDKKNIGNGAEDFRKEVTPKVGINDSLLDPMNDEDPISSILKMNAGKIPTQDSQTTSGSDSAVASVPTADECNALLTRMKTGEDLAGDSKDKMNQCLDQNIAKWSPDQIQFAKALLNDNTLTPEEKDLLRKGIAGTATPAELALLRALTGNDPTAKLLAREAIQKAVDDETKKALADALAGKQLSDAQKALLSGLISEAAAALGKTEKGIYDSLLAGKDGTSGGIALGADGSSGSNGMSPEALAALAAEMANKEAELRAMQDKLAQAQAEAASAFARGAKGLAMNAAEQAQINRLAELQKQLAELERLQNARRLAVLKNASRMQKTLAAVAKTVDEVIPSSFSIAYEDAPPPLDCKSIKPLGRRISRVKRVKNSSTLLGLDGKPLSPDKVKLIALRRKNMIEISRTRDNVMNPTGPNSGFTSGLDALDTRAFFGDQGGQKTDVQSLFVFSDKNLKSFSLTPDMKIPGVLVSQILVTDKGRPAIVRVKILDNVYNPENNNIVIPKGSIVVGTTQSFDADTGMIDLNLNKVSIGSGKMVIQNFTVGSADGRTGLAGRVYDTRGKYLLGAFVASFSAGALNFFSQQVVQPFKTATDPATAIGGAALGGGAEALGKLSELMVSDLQNAAKIFYVPKGVPIILYPTE
jgi:hypothetical protein